MRLDKDRQLPILEPGVSPIGTRSRKASRFMIAIQSLLQWFTHNPLGAATVLFIAGILGVLVYAYFEPQDQR